MANVGPNFWYIRDNAPTSTIGWSAVTAWATGATIAAGVLRRQLAAPTVGNERVFAAIVAGTTHATTEPTWVVTKGAKTTDNTVTWQEVTGQPGVNGDTTNCPTWLQNKNVAVTIGMIITDAVVDTLFICTTAGTTGNGAEPTWNKTAGVTTTDNGATWTSLGAVGNFGSWAAPFARMQSAVAANWMAAGNTLFVGNDHAETQSTASTVTFPGTVALPNSVYSIDHTASFPLTGTNISSGAAVTVTGSNALTVNGSLAINGFTLTGGSALNIGTTNSSFSRLDNCALIKSGASGGIVYTIGSTSAKTLMNNTTVKFGATGDLMVLSNLQWRNTASAIQGSTFPTTFLFTNGSGGGLNILEGVDLSALGSGVTLVSNGSNANGQFYFMNCKLGGSVTIALSPSNDQHTVDYSAIDSSGTNYQFGRWTTRGTLLTETTIIRTGGASAGTAVSYKIATTSTSLWITPFDCTPITIWNTVTGSNVTCTLAGIWNSASLPNNDQIWVDIEYFGSSGSPLGSIATETKANNLATGTALTADSTSAWDSVATARANTTAYSLGNTIKVASNSGRVFFCTTAGTSAGSEPGGFASAVDGGSVTDGAAVFRAGVRFLLAVTLSSPQPQLAGYLRAIVKAALPSSTFYVDPLIVLS